MELHYQFSQIAWVISSIICETMQLVPLFVKANPQ